MTATAPASKPPVPFGRRLAQRLAALEPTRSQAWLAEQSGLATSRISRLIKGTRNPTLDAVQCLAPVLGVKPAQLLAGTDAQERLEEAARLVPTAQLERALEALEQAEESRRRAEARARAAEEATAAEASVRKQLQEELGAARHEVHGLKSDLGTARREKAGLQRVKAALEQEDRRKLHGLKRAAARINELQARVLALEAQIRGKLDEASTNSKVGAWLAGIAAGAGLVTVASLLGRGDDEHDEGIANDFDDEEDEY